MITGLMHSHNALGYLLLASTTVSLVLAVVNLASGPRPGLLKAGGVMARGIEMSTVGLTGLVGLALWFAAPGASAVLLGGGLVAVIVSSVLIARGIKPALAGMRDGADLRGRWAALAAVHWVVIVGAVGLMHGFSRM